MSFTVADTTAGDMTSGDIAVYAVQDRGFWNYERRHRGRGIFTASKGISLHTVGNATDIDLLRFSVQGVSVDCPTAMYPQMKVACRHHLPKLIMLRLRPAPLLDTCGKWVRT